jgi:hypothetical protein
MQHERLSGQIKTNISTILYPPRPPKIIKLRNEMQLAILCYYDHSNTVESRYVKQDAVEISVKFKLIQYPITTRYSEMIQYR